MILQSLLDKRVKNRVSMEDVANNLAKAFEGLDEEEEPKPEIKAPVYPLDGCKDFETWIRKYWQVKGRI